jgi:predicted helicase
MTRMIDFYNKEVERFDKSFPDLEKKAREAKTNIFIDTDATRISWSDALKQELAKGRKFAFDEKSLITCLYRPFNKQWMYFNRHFNERMYRMRSIFPEASAENRAILVKGNLANAGQIALMVNTVVDLQPDRGAQCFPMYVYEIVETDVTAVEDRPSGAKPQSNLFAEQAEDLFEAARPKYQRHEGLTDEGLSHFHAAYLGEPINKDDVFYYVYGLLHSSDYRERYADNLAKELPRIPCVKNASDFWAFSKAGRQLAELHLNYVTVDKYPLQTVGDEMLLTDADYRVEKMRYGKKGKDRDLTTLHYNDKITLTGIPLEAYEYVVNGKPALDWVVERQCIKTDKDSGIVNDANLWATC